jgi:hypothetical protein
MKTDKNSQSTQSGTPAQPKQIVPDNKHTRISYEKWWDKYRPIKNHIAPDAGYDGCMFETYGEEVDYIYTCNHKHVWTLLDCDGKMRIAEGRHYVNRMGFFVTEVEAPANRWFCIKAD